MVKLLSWRKNGITRNGIEDAQMDVICHCKEFSGVDVLELTSRCLSLRILIVTVRFAVTGLPVTVGTHS